jgi:hypothetical protein
MTNTARFFLLTTVIIVGTQYAGAWRADADFIQTNLVSDIPALAALTDPNLQNPWGISHSPTSPFWVSDQRTNITTLYAPGHAAASGVGMIDRPGQEGRLRVDQPTITERLIQLRTHAARYLTVFVDQFVARRLQD